MQLLDELGRRDSVAGTFGPELDRGAQEGTIVLVGPVAPGTSAAGEGIEEAVTVATHASISWARLAAILRARC